MPKGYPYCRDRSQGDLVSKGLGRGGELEKKLSTKINREGRKIVRLLSPFRGEKGSGGGTKHRKKIRGLL